MGHDEKAPPYDSLAVPSLDHARRRSMKYEEMPLPPGWIRQFDTASHHHFYVCPRASRCALSLTRAQNRWTPPRILLEQFGTIHMRTRSTCVLLVTMSQTWALIPRTNMRRARIGRESRRQIPQALQAQGHYLISNLSSPRVPASSAKSST